MDRKLDRRLLSKTAGAFAGIGIAGRLFPAIAQEGTPVAGGADASEETTGTISGVVTAVDSGDPLADVYIVVGWRDVQRAGITDEEGRYTVSNVPAGQEVDVLGFREGGYRYHNSDFDANTVFTLDEDETATYDFTLALLDQPEGEPKLSDPVIDPMTVRPGEDVTFAVTARNGAGGLSPEIIAANPEIGRMVLMESVGDDRFRTTVTFGNDTAPGDYPFAFFAASVECFVNSEFPMVTLSIGEGEATPAPSTGPEQQQGDAQTEVTVEMVDIEFNPNEFTIPADTEVTIMLPNNGATTHDFNIDGKNNPSDPNVHSGNVQGGQSTTVTVNLPAGDWYYYCSLPGHEAAGMFGTAHVE